jgi:hypothetical protein
MRLRWKIAAPVAGLLALGLGVAAVQAASPTPSSTKTPGQIFIDKLAGILHLPAADVQKDVKQAQLDTVKQLLADGKISQAQADAMTKRIESGQSPYGQFVPHAPRMNATGALMKDLMTAELNAAASALKTTPDKLKADLKAGKSLADLEKAAGIDDKTFRADLVKAAKGVLDKAVAAGTITQQQETMILNRIQSGGLGPFGRPRPFGGFGHGGKRPAGPTGPSGPTGPKTQSYQTD